MARRSIYSREQRLAPGTYEAPLADFLDALPGYINQYQRNKLVLDKQELEDKRYEDALTATKAQRIEEQKRYNQEQTRLAQKTAYDKGRQKVADAVTAAREVRAIKKAEDDKETKNLTLTLSSLNDEQKLPYLISRKGLDGDDTADLKIIQKSTDDFNLSLRPIIDIAPAGNIKNINKSLLDINTFMEKNKDNPLFKASSSAYTKVITKRDKLLTRLNQVSSDGYVDPKYWTQVDPTRGKVAKALYDKSVENIGAYASDKALTDDLSRQKTIDAKIAGELANQEKIRQGFKLASIPEIKSVRERISPYVSAVGGETSDLAGFQTFQTPPTFDPNAGNIEPILTEAEMDDVSKQLAMDQGEIESNLAKINETIPGLATATPTDTTAITNENITALTGDEAEAYNPNKVGLDPDDPSTVPASFLEPITDGGDEAPEVVDTTPEVEVADTGGLGNSAITDRLFPEQVSATTIDPLTPEGVSIDNLFKGDSEVDVDPSPSVKVKEEPIKIDRYKPRFETGKVTDKQKKRIESYNLVLRKNDPDFMKSTKIAEDIYTSNVRDIDGNRLDLLNFSDFDKKINAMRKKIKYINDDPRSDPSVLMTKPEGKLLRKQYLLEQRQLFNDLKELQSKLNSTSEYFYFPQENSSGKQTGKLTRKSTDSYKRAINSAIKSIPKQLRFIDQLN